MDALEQFLALLMALLQAVAGNAGVKVVDVVVLNAIGEKLKEPRHLEVGRGLKGILKVPPFIPAVALGTLKSVLHVEQKHTAHGSDKGATPVAGEQEGAVEIETGKADQGQHVFIPPGLQPLQHQEVQHGGDGHQAGTVVHKGVERLLSPAELHELGCCEGSSLSKLLLVEVVGVFVVVVVAKRPEGGWGEDERTADEGSNVVRSVGRKGGIVAGIMEKHKHSQ